MSDVDIFEEWHKFLAKIRQMIAEGQIKVSCELSDYDLAVQYVISIANKENYKTLTAEQIWHLLKAFTDVEADDN